MPVRWQDFDGSISVRRAEHGTLGHHAHDFLEIAYILQGEATYYIGDETQPLRAGDFITVDYRTEHAYELPQGHLHLINCLFLPSLLDEGDTVSTLEDIGQRFASQFNGKQLRGPIANRVFHDTDGTVKRIFLCMEQEYTEKQTGYQQLLRCLLTELLFFMIRQIGITEWYSEPVRELLALADAGYRSQLRLSDFCRERYYSPSYVSARFRQEVGMTFTEYIQKKRIEESCYLLRGTQSGIVEIAEAVGYSNLKFFGQVFRRVMGMSPRDYRSFTRKQNTDNVLVHSHGGDRIDTK